MYTLPEGLKLLTKTSNKDYKIIKEIIKTTDLSGYLLDINDFFVLKDKQGEIASFGRLLDIGENCKEICSVWVNPKRRGEKIGLYLCERLIEHKKGNHDVYLATKTSLESYYSRIGFSTIQDNIPEKLVYTGIWAKENGIEFVIMKYK